jgi:preprotein translocase subunit SecE
MTYVVKIKDYFHGAIAELRKVSWPTKKQTTTYSIVVVALTIGVAVFFGILDFVFSKGLGLLIN